MSSRTVTLKAELSALDPIADMVIEFAELAGLEHRALYQLRLAVDEIATNIILHGYAEHGMEGDIVVTATLDERALVISLEDTSPRFDPLLRDIERVEADFSKSLEERKIGGLGIYFAIKAVDDFHYEYRDGRNRNVFTVCRPSAAVVRESATAEHRP